MKMLADNVRFKNVTHFENKLFRSMSPNRQNNIVNWLFVLFQPEVDVTTIFKKLRPVVKFRSQLLHITRRDQN